jgi:hypothetical protein
MVLGYLAGAVLGGGGVLKFPGKSAQKSLLNNTYVFLAPQRAFLLWCPKDFFLDTVHYGLSKHGGLSRIFGKPRLLIPLSISA